MPEGNRRDGLSPKSRKANRRSDLKIQFDGKQPKTTNILEMKSHNIEFCTVWNEFPASIS